MQIRHRIMIWVAGAGLLTSLAFSFVVFWELREAPLEMIDAQLKSTAFGIAGQMSTKPEPRANPRAIILPFSAEGYWIKIYDQDLRVVYQSQLAGTVDLPLYKNKGEEGYLSSVRLPKKRIDLQQNDEDEVTFRVRLISEKIKATPYLIQIAKPVEKLEDEISDLLAAIGIGLAVSTVLLAALSYFLAGRILKPIAVINQLTHEINENTLGKRIPVGKSRDEIHELATRMNSMFDRLQFSFALQKRLLADASHELKSPIAMLRLFFDEALQDSNLPEDFHRQLDTQGRIILRMDRLVRTLLELSTLEIKEALTKESFDLAELACTVAADFEPLAERGKIRMEIEVPPHLEIKGDRDRIRRALINLFDNAVKYNKDEGRIQFTVSKEKDRLHLSLYNTGPGIPEEDLPKVFDQFYRVEKSRATESGGAGLGLAIVREIVRLHGGTISIDSRLGLWVRIDILLPTNGDSLTSQVEGA
jgi:two-component system, OmpR family, sensor kinase